MLKVCSNCVMDTTDPNIFFDENDVCNHCINFNKNIKPLLDTTNKREIHLEEEIKKIKEKKTRIRNLIA